MEKHILITGGAGFIGSHLCELLVNQGHKVLAVDDLSTGRLENLASLQGAANFQFVRKTITNTQVLDRLTHESSLIIHLAAVVGYKTDRGRPGPYHSYEYYGNGRSIEGSQPLWCESNDCLYF